MAKQPASKPITSSGRSHDNLETSNRREADQNEAEARERDNATQADQNPSRDTSNPQGYAARAATVAAEANKHNTKQK